MKYRSDIDGLRAVAVLPVLFFHANFSLFSGGFVGVDVFFVISGFLITSIIFNEQESGHFSIRSFYERRIRRILPIFLLVTFATFAASYFIFLPSSFKFLGQTMVASAFFGSNILFWKKTDYFANLAEDNPLLHTWSLSVEEQFYVFFPIALLLIRKFVGRYVSHSLVLLTLCSFALSIYLVNRDPVSAFYLAPNRAWEILLGSLLAVGRLPQIKGMSRDFLSVLGIGLLSLSIFSYDAETPFPGLAALAPCLGTALIIYCGSGGLTTTVNKLLGFRPLVYIGKISYSLYLWHWPVLILARYWNIYELTKNETILLLLFSALLSVTTYTFLEQPVRRRLLLKTQSHVFLFAGGLSLASVLVGLFLHFSNGWPERFSHLPQQVVAPDPNTQWRYPKDCGNYQTEIDANKTLSICKLGSEDKKAVLFWGDSHAEQIYPAVEQVAQTNREVKFLFATSPGCPPTVSMNRKKKGFYCNNFGSEVLKLALASDIKTVNLIMSSFYFIDSKSDVHLCKIQLNGECTNFADQSAALAFYINSLKDLVNKLKSEGKRVNLFLPFPVYEVGVSKILIKNLIYGKEIDYDRLKEISSKPLREALINLSKETGVDIIDPRKALCSDNKCKIGINGITYYKDPGHLNILGSSELLEVLKYAL
ncbi:MAG: acyltransferase family protein [Pseudomonadota bacterium]|nr:acyltransferase family protein [Pseudomonadota bacterium]